MSGSSQINDTWIGDREEALFLTLTLLENSTEVRDFLIDLLTPEEIQNIAKRWCIARLLYAGETQESVRIKCSASRIVVSRVNRSFIKKSSGVSKMVDERLQQKGTFHQP